MLILYIYINMEVLKVDNFKNENMQKKERQLEDLSNLVERHTRTERHLEQYSEIGSKRNKDNARKKQEVRENEIDNLKNKIVGKNENETKEKQIENIIQKYRSTEGYIENNYENLSDEALENMQKKQENRKIQVENLSENIETEE